MKVQCTRLETPPGKRDDHRNDKSLEKTNAAVRKKAPVVSDDQLLLRKKNRSLRGKRYICAILLLQGIGSWEEKRSQKRRGGENQLVSDVDWDGVLIGRIVGP